MIKAAHVPSEKMACQGVITALFNGSTENSGGGKLVNNVWLELEKIGT
jgi:hypothetical protein